MAGKTRKTIEQRRKELEAMSFGDLINAAPEGTQIQVSDQVWKLPVPELATKVCKVLVQIILAEEFPDQA